MSNARANKMTPPVSNSLREYARGMAGGLMFSLPLLYTMEVWWAGFVAEPMRLVLYVAAVFILLLGYNHYVGLHQEASRWEVVIDSVEEMGLGLIVATGLLFLLGQIETDHTVFETIGKIVIEAMTVAIGISIGTSQLGGSDEGEEGGGKKPRKNDATFGGHIALAGCGAVLFASNVAPTEEILMIAAESHLVKLLGLVLLSLAIAAVILYYIEFTGSARLRSPSQGFMTVVVGTVLSYAVALVVSAAILWFFGRFDDVALLTCVAQIVVLGLAATLGSSAGRLLLQ